MLDSIKLFINFFALVQNFGKVKRECLPIFFVPNVLFLFCDSPHLHNCARLRQDWIGMNVDFNFITFPVMRFSNKIFSPQAGLE